MNTPIYGELLRLSSASASASAPVIRQLISQVRNILAGITPQNKQSSIEQLDNIRHQLYVLMKRGNEFIPYKTSMSTNNIQRDIHIDASGNLAFYNKY